ncbi:unnamed protein product [Arabidopsis halleri]
MGFRLSVRLSVGSIRFSVLSVLKFSIHSDILKFRFGFGLVPVLSVLKFSIHSVILLKIFSDISVIFEYFRIFLDIFRLFLSIFTIFIDFSSIFDYLVYK